MIHPVKTIEYFLLLLGGNPYPCISHIDRYFIRLLFQPDLDRSFFREFRGIVYEIA